MIRHAIAASAMLFAATFGAAAAPVPAGASAPAIQAPILEVKRGGHGHGWGHHRGRHYGWNRGRHRGWYNHHRRHRGWHGPRRHRW